MIAHQRDENKTKYFIYKNIGSPLKSPVGLEKVKRLTSLTALENTAQAQLLRLSARNHCSNVLRSHCSSMLLFHARPLRTQNHCSKHALRPPSALNHCSSMLLFPLKALSAMLLFPSKFLSKSLCFELCIASSCTLCDFTGAVRRHMRI